MSDLFDEPQSEKQEQQEQQSQQQQEDDFVHEPLDQQQQQQQQQPEQPPAAAPATSGSSGGGGGGDSSDVDAGKKMLLCCSFLERTNPQVKSLLLWSDPKRSAAVLFSTLTLLWACMAQSFVSVLAYLGLAALLCTCAMRLYAYTMNRRGGGAVASEQAGEQQQQQQHEMLACLQEPIRLPRTCVLGFVEGRLDRAEACANCLLDLLLFRDSMRTLKFFCGLVALTYVGSWFNALTLVSVAVATAFCLPKVYSIYHRKVDSVLAHVLDRYRHVNATIRAAIPFGKEKKN